MGQGASALARGRRQEGRGQGAMNAAIIFGLLLALMLTGMPISISLGLTVLTFVLTMTEVPLQSVALKLFTGIEKWEIMAIPFFILARQLPYPRRRGAADDRLRDLAGRPLSRRPCARLDPRLRHVRARLRLERGDGRGDRLDRAA